MTDWIVFVTTSAAFWLGAAADARSSMGQLEKTRYFKDKNGRFSLKRYLLVMAGIWGASLTAHLTARSLPVTIFVGGLLVMGAVVRFLVAKKNRKTQAKNRLRGVE